MKKLLLTLTTAVGVATTAHAGAYLPKAETLRPLKHSGSTSIVSGSNASLVDADNSTCWDSGTGDAMIYFNQTRKNPPSKMEDWLKVAMKLAKSHGIGDSGAIHWYISGFIETLADLKGLEDKYREN